MDKDLELELTGNSLPNQFYNIGDGKKTISFAPTCRKETEMNGSVVEVVGMWAQKKQNSFFESVRIISNTKGCYAKLEDVLTAMEQQFVKFTSFEDVINYKYNKETLEVSLAFKGRTDTRQSNKNSNGI